MLSTAAVTIFSLYVKEDGVNIQFPFNYVFGLMLVSIGLVNFVIIKELLSIHSSRVITLRQANCLRQAMDSIRYKKYVGTYPESVSDLLDQSTEYWKRFGRHRKLPLENDGLRGSERGIFRSPDKFMILILATMSLIVMMSPVVYLSASPNATFTDGWVSGVISLLFFVGVAMQINDSKKRLRVQLGAAEDANKKIQPTS